MITCWAAMTAIAKDTNGATAIEYALIASFISISILVGALFIGENLDASYRNVASKLDESNN